MTPTDGDVLDALSFPAKALVVVGILGAGLGLVAVAGLVAPLAVPQPTLPYVVYSTTLAGVLVILLLLISLGAIAGGVAMHRGSSYRWAVFGALCASVNLLCPLFGLAIGVWCLVVLRRKETREAFVGSMERGRRDRELESLRLAVPGVLLVFIGVLGLLTAAIVAIDTSAYLTEAPDGPGLSLAGRVVLGAILGVPAAIVAAGGLAMLCRRRRPLAVTACVLTLAPCGIFLPGIPVGVWGLVLLRRPSIRDAFQRD